LPASAATAAGSPANATSRVPAVIAADIAES